MSVYGQVAPAENPAQISEAVVVTDLGRSKAPRDSTNMLLQMPQMFLFTGRRRRKIQFVFNSFKNILAHY